MVVQGTFASRLNALCDEKRIPPKGKNRQQLVGKLFGVSQEAARKWLEDEGLPKMETVIEIATWGGVAVEWLLTGRGPRQIPEATDPSIATVWRLMEPMSDFRKQDVVKIVAAIADKGGTQTEQ